MSLQRNLLYRAAHIANFEGILGFSVPSIIFSDGGVTVFSGFNAGPQINTWSWGGSCRYIPQTFISGIIN